MIMLEICCCSMECARTVQQNGAGRIELCLAPKEGGLTPSLGVLRSIRQHISIPADPIICPRGGDSCYIEGEFTAMLGNIVMAGELGFSGLVIDILDVDGSVDMPRMEKMMIAAGSLQATFHRAFDMCTNPLNALKKLAGLGIVRVLTSGRKSDAIQDLTEMMGLIMQPGTPIIMAGARVCASSLSPFLDAGVQEIHGSTEVWLTLPTRYHNPGLSMFLDAQADRYSCHAVNGMVVVETKAIIAHHQVS